MSVRPSRLRPGDTILVVAPSWGGGAHFPHRAKRGIEQLERMGFRVQLANHAMNGLSYVSDTPEHRAADIHAGFADPQVRAIFSLIGGDHSCHLLPLLDWELIRHNPKIFMGYSDITVLNVAIWQMTGLITFNGPTLMTELAEYPAMFPYSESHMRRALCEPAPLGRLLPAEWWTDEILRWEGQQDLSRPRAGQPTSGWTWLKPGRGEGILLGGCLESLQHLRGTPFWPAWDDAILFFETSEELPSPATVDGILMDYRNMGIFERLQGLLVGRPMGYSDENRQTLRRILLERTAGYTFPIIADMDFGHTSPMLTLPLGCRTRLDTAIQRMEVVEPAVC